MNLYRDLPIHQKITAKGNAVVFYRYTERLLAMICNRPAEFYTPGWPEYLMHYNFKEPSANQLESYYQQ